VYYNLNLLTLPAIGELLGLSGPLDTWGLGGGRLVLLSTVSYYRSLIKVEAVDKCTIN